MTFQKTNARTVAAYAMAALMLAAAVAAGVSIHASAQQSQEDGSSQLDAQQIYETNSITVDPDVKTLVIAIPDNAGTGRSAWEGFLPSNATVATGTAVVLLNADVNATHRITMSSEETGQSAVDTIPYQNTSTYRLDAPGQYTFTDPVAEISGTINVVDNASLTDDPVTNASRSAVGLFIAPASAQAEFEDDLSHLGFNAVSAYNFEAQDASAAETPSADGTDTGDGGMTLFVYTQEVSHPNTIDGRLASKVRALEGLLYPGDAIKQNVGLSN